GHLAGATVHDQVDDKRKAEETRDDERSRNDLAPPYSAPDAARIDAPLLVSTPVPSRCIPQIQCSRVRTAWPRTNRFWFFCRMPARRRSDHLPAAANRRCSALVSRGGLSWRRTARATAGPGCWR